MSEQTNDESTPETLGSSEPVANPALEKDPSDWTTGDEPMTDAQRSYLDTLAREAGRRSPPTSPRPRRPSTSTGCRGRPAAARTPDGGELAVVITTASPGRAVGRPPAGVVGLRPARAGARGQAGSTTVITTLPRT
ncbi:hypothetical protein GCM10025875_32800 [Litorihabitans aurantiacus]|uniref:DUF3072 domain-containing protein n=1 Tax=Litorihabitans aurantiacus TaxID=1930061 RepID=A0AA37XHG1_9MICO|nr:hypothetical protein GCM10025875_32800 [Litorihabitans aurantiacus]